MKLPAVALPLPVAPARPLALADVLRWSALAACAAVLAGCASQTAVGPGRPGPGGRYFDPILGVWASPRVVDDGEAVPRGGGGFLVGRPYTIGGHLYVPNADPRGYVAVGTASWYGDAFHGRRTANGEIFDKGSISAAHPTLPLPSYVRVTNLKNGRSLIVRVNDRGPYHGGRVMDVSQRVAEALAFRNEGTGRVRIEYVGRATLAGDDDERLLATLTTDGRPARLDGVAEPVQVADAALPPRPTGPSPLPNFPARVASLPIFRRGPPAEGPVPAAPPVEPVAAPAPPRATRALAAPVEASPRRAAPARTGPVPRDPFFKPLFPPPKREAAPRATISFGGPARRPVPPRRSPDEAR
ncbi:septal ring lytic transglycosylase RlpA family protein [Lichenibacterium dinghuense]|uniref:septal ring lytic transglycosylase RlpA family protein n=1 Tax=Lichenibacterium dinghuense TaxID=2895977 RepID=UPI00272DF9B7|nr:septal ring lytic transglycosylase RlpA family protein [Lichenibacterium sp. 6Y81]